MRSRQSGLAPELWAYDAMIEELSVLGEDMSARNIHGSGVHHEAEQRVRKKYLWALEDEQRAWIRETEDAFDAFGVPERLYTKWRLKKPMKRIPEKVIMGERDRLE